MAFGSAGNMQRPDIDTAKKKEMEIACECLVYQQREDAAAYN